MIVEWTHNLSILALAMHQKLQLSMPENTFRSDATNATITDLTSAKQDKPLIFKIYIPIINSEVYRKSVFRVITFSSPVICFPVDRRVYRPSISKTSILSYSLHQWPSRSYSM